MLRSSQDEPIAASQPADQLAELKRLLMQAIDTYIDRCTTKPVKASLSNNQGYRLHYMNGEEGKARAIKYKEKINAITAYDELVLALLEDLKAVAAEQEKDTVYNKTVGYLSAGWEYARAKVMGDEKRPVIEPANLGNSEALAGDISRALCGFLKLNPFNEEVYNEMKRVNEAAAASYRASELKRIIIAIEDYLNPPERRNQPH